MLVSVRLDFCLGYCRDGLGLIVIAITQVLIRFLASGYDMLLAGPGVRPRRPNSALVVVIVAAGIRRTDNLFIRCRHQRAGSRCGTIFRGLNDEVAGFNAGMFRS